MEEGVVRAVRQGISTYAEDSHYQGRTSLYPPVLDDAESGDATAQNLFFSYVLERGIAVEGWTKAGVYEYGTPSGEKINYNPKTGSFQ